MQTPEYNDETLFADALELPHDRRSRLLDEACRGDSGLRQRVEDLLAAHAAAGGSFLEESPAELARFNSADDAVGDQIGRYTLLEKIGEGGWSTVYLARQDEPVRREVALKIVKLGMDTREIIARFDAERQALALMDHPNIARVLDGGATETGRPYFVMDLVRGTPITNYCDQKRLSVAERLRLFIEVCHAVQHAHQKGVIHRDIKPSNVLVAECDGAAVPRVIDFGIAKAVSAPLTNQAFLTAAVHFIGTPAYMSPEQAEMGGRNIDTRTDIYSLGVLLYELLTGRTPLEAAELAEVGFDAMRRRIKESEPKRPSTRLTTLDTATLGSIARHRRIEPHRLVKTVERELDWISMRCLEKDRARRYPTAIGLAEDILRFQRHETVCAGPPSRMYALAKFSRRHRTLLASGGTIAILLVACTIVTHVLHMRARHAEQRAEAEAAAVRQVLDFMRSDVFGAATPGAPPVPDLRLSTVLERADARLRDRFNGQPAVEAMVRAILGSTHETIGEYEPARRHFSMALALRRQSLGTDHPDSLATAHALARIYSSLGRFAAAERLWRDSLGRQRAVLGADHPVTLRSANGLGAALLNLGRTDDATALAGDTLGRAMVRLGSDHRDTIESMRVLSWGHLQRKNPAVAEPLARESYERSRRVLGNDDTVTVAARTNFARVLHALHKPGPAEVLHRENVEIMRRLHGPSHPETLVAMHNLAHVVQQDGSRLAEADGIVNEVLEAKRRTLGEDHPSTLNSRAIHALIIRKMGRVEEAGRIQADLASKYESRYGAGHPSALLMTRQLAATRRLESRLPEAELLIRKAIEGYLREMGRDHPDTLASREELGRVLILQGRPDEAVAVLEPVLGVRIAKDPDGERRAIAGALLGEALLRIGSLDRAAPYLSEASECFGKLPPPVSPEARMQLRRNRENLDELIARKAGSRGAVALRAEHNR